MKVMITGGTGFVGSHTVSELIKNGHKVRLLVRSMEKVGPALQPFGVQDVEPVCGDVLNRESVKKAAEGCDATIHCGSVYSLDARDAAIIRNTNVGGTENVLDVAYGLGHDPIIHVSSYVALIGKKGTTITPDSPATQPPGIYCRSKADSDQVARRFQEAGAPVVISYPGSVWGPYDPHFGESCQMARNILNGSLRMTVKGKVPISDVRDIASLHTSLLEKGKGPRRYFAAMRNITIGELYSAIAGVTGRKLNTVMLPGWSVLLPMRGLDFLQKILPSRLPFNFQTVYSVTRNHLTDDSDTRKDFGIEPLPVADTMADQIRWMAQQGYISPSLAGTLSDN